MGAAGHNNGLLSPVRSVTSSRGGGRDVRFCIQTSEDDVDEEVARGDDTQRLTSTSSIRSRPPRSPSSDFKVTVHECQGHRPQSPRSPSSDVGATLTAEIARPPAKPRGHSSVRSKSGATSRAAHRGSSVTSSTFDAGGLYTVEYLYGLPPLFLAAVYRNATAVRLLLDHGAVPNFTHHPVAAVTYDAMIGRP